MWSLALYMLYLYLSFALYISFCGYLLFFLAMAHRSLLALSFLYQFLSNKLAALSCIFAFKHGVEEEQTQHNKEQEQF